MKLIVAATMILTLVACGSSLTVAGASVQQASANRVAKCSYVGTFTEDNDNVGGYMPSSDRKSAMINLKNRVAQAGGTHVVVLGGESSWWKGDSEFTAEAYRCR